MKKILVLLSLFLVSSFNGFSQSEGPNIEFESTVVDYGEILKGSNGIRVFTFTNTGDSPLEISKVYSSCGCTIPKKPEAPIAPGEKGEIQVKYDTNRLGPIRKTITVNSNATATPIVSLKIKGKVADSTE
ncbi:DUF1573 domain-containing protein [Flavobacteriaceae bacterium]|uniref:DUF1573 domain-containing protein n=1 Tax=Candidatus Arcticimaribacter forsetii TaxID=2820661 RepID=UPI002076D5E3|nr:DUF1573 domain-containing protein [Candidatus Arcticimaribacter forsetii]MDB2326041.1 DUF1573 domain-containing protein [Flavobacteriaceae bacterium]MDB2345513.1 DUF1573 domain-containing protein [Flavobacteriaceae bacterium]MDB2457098.1 DUF1573 domain-containing protein [Flavobacteriaceae bacterium]MDB4608657.1 DUF1573 domain-containing protein [Flavobacteriaceae bacterium]MDB4643394.1 DUF1573 domain-containing protein [Flavobacteriaceae bacterium]